jgi:hypothetical protein
MSDALSRDTRAYLAQQHLDVAAWIYCVASTNHNPYKFKRYF